MIPGRVDTPAGDVRIRILLKHSRSTFRKFENIHDILKKSRTFMTPLDVPRGRRDERLAAEGGWCQVSTATSVMEGFAFALRHTTLGFGFGEQRSFSKGRGDTLAGGVNIRFRPEHSSTANSSLTP